MSSTGLRPRPPDLSVAPPPAGPPAPPPGPPHPAAAPLSEDARATFITRSYVHLYGAIVGFTLFEALLFMSGLAMPLARAFLSVSWLWILGSFVLVSWLASRIAHKAESRAVQ